MDDRIAHDVTSARVGSPPATRARGRQGWLKRIGKILGGLFLVLFGVLFIRNGGVIDLVLGGIIAVGGLGTLTRALGDDR